LPRGPRRVPQHAGLPRRDDRPASQRADLAAPRSRDLYVGRPARRVSRSASRRRDRARARVGTRVAQVTLRTVLRLGRVSNLPTVASNVLAAIALAGGRPSIALLALACA